jgi:hypothetical protein
MRTRLRPIRRLASYDPHPHQVVFHKDNHKYRAMVTGVGAGKTRMGVEEVLKWTQIYPGSLGVIGRLTQKSLKNTTQRRFFEVCPPELIQDFNKSDGHLWIKTNETDEDGYPVFSEILFYHLDDPGPLGSLDISYFWIDEAHEPDGGEVPEATFTMLTARLRHPVGPHRGFVTSNSGGKDWVWKWFFRTGHPKEYTGWTASSQANERYLPEGYVEELRRNNSEAWVNRFLDASFDAFEGQVYTDFDEEVHVFDPSEMPVVPLSWDHGVGFDFGITAATAAEYGAVDFDGDIWIYDEIYKPNVNVESFAKDVKERGITDLMADPSVVNRGPTKKSPQDLYLEEGINLMPASNDEDFFMTFLIKLFRKRVLNPDGSYRGVIHISKKCVHLIEQLKREAWDPQTIAGTTHDKVKRQENHARDAFKYLINTIGLNPGLLSPLTPRKKRKAELEEVHTSYTEDEDLEDEKYPHIKVKKMIEYDDELDF